MWFRILGTLEVVVDDVVVQLQGRHQPKLLATLLLEMGQVVPIHRLVDALWDDDPPGTARRQVQNGVAALRRLLAAHGDDPVESVGDGYRLTTDRLDARLFTDEMHRARGLVEGGDHSAAHSVLCRALELWRGTALAGIPGRLIASGAERWNEQRSSALKMRMETELAMGQPGRVVSEARALVDVHPYRQDLVGLLMSALHHSGRTAEALTAYDGLRLRLAEDLGIDPDESLQDLHRSMLRGHVHPESPRTAPMPVPTQLPADNPLVGRRGSLAELDRLFAEGVNSAVVTGAAGVGKTALALHWGHRHMSRFPDGQLFVNLRGYDRQRPLTADEVLHRSLRAWGYAPDQVPADHDEAAALLRSTLNGRRVLMVLDNAGSADQVRSLLPSGGSFALITSRSGMTGLTAVDGVPVVPLGSLGRDRALELLSGMVGAERVRDTAAARRVVDLCDRLPLALRIVGAHVAARPHLTMSDVADELAGTDRLERLTIPGDSRATVADGIGLSLATLDPDTKRFFLLSSLIPAPTFSEELAGAVNAVEERETRRHIELLVDAHLMQRHSRGRLRFHDLVRLYGERQATEELGRGEMHDARARILKWYRAPNAHDDYEDIMTVIAAFETHPAVWHAAMGLERLVHGGEDTALIREVAGSCLAVADENDDDRGRAAMHNLVAGTFWAERRFDRAGESAELAVRFARAADDDVLLGRHLNNLAHLSIMRGDNLSAERMLSDALEISRRSGSVYAVAARLGALGDVRRRLGRYEQARRDLLDGLDWSFRGSDRDYHPTVVPLQTAELCFDQGRYEECRRYVDQALASPNRARHRNARILSARVKLAVGDIANGHAELMAVHEDKRANRHGASVATLLQPLAESLLSLGRIDEAHDVAQECLKAGVEHQQVHDRAAGHLLMCHVYNELADFASAVSHGEMARDLYAAMPEPLREARALDALAVSHLGLDDRVGADERRREATNILGDIGIAMRRLTLVSEVGVAARWTVGDRGSNRHDMPGELAGLGGVDGVARGKDSGQAKRGIGDAVGEFELLVGNVRRQGVDGLVHRVDDVEAGVAGDFHLR